MTKQIRTKRSDTATAGPEQAPEVSTRGDTKVANLIALLTAIDGAILDQIVTATGWLPHTTHAGHTRLKARGYAIIGVKVDGVRICGASGPAGS